MPIGSELFNRLRHLGRRSRFEAGLDDEIQFHIEARVSELVESGLARREAVVQARREFGPMVRAREESRAAWQFRWLEDFASDLRYAGRAFRRNPGFTLTAVLSLALGIGANTAIFTAMDAVLWKPLPVADPHSLVRLAITRTNRDDTNNVAADLINVLRRSGSFTDIAATAGDGLSLSYDGPAERIIGEFVSPNYFKFLGVEPMLGQGFTPEVRSGRWAAEVVLSYSFWKRRFGGDPGVIGRTVRLNTYPFTIVGVSPASFFGVTQGSDYELRIPILPAGQTLTQIQGINGAPNHAFNVLARLRPGMTIAQAEAKADAQFQEYLRNTPLAGVRRAGRGHLRLLPGERGWSGDLAQFENPLWVLLWLVAAVLLIACANVASMLLARATARRRELAVRVSIGAGRARLIRQMLAESLLLATLGGAGGIAVAAWADQLLIHFLPQGHISLVVDIHPDIRALLFTAALAIITGVLFGLVPALQTTRGDLAVSLKTDAAASAGQAGGSFRKALVASQVAFSLVLLVVAGLFVRTLANLRPSDYHVQPERVLLFTIKPQQELYTTDRIRTLTSELARRVAALPGVRSAAFAEDGPLGSRTSRLMIEIPGHEPVQAADDAVSPGFFDAIGVPLIAGRDFSAGDRPGAPMAAIINNTLARALFKEENPLGRTIVWPGDKNDPHRYEVVGVAADAHYYDVHKASPPTVYVAGRQDGFYMPTLHVRATVSDTAAMVAAIRHVFDEVDKGFPVFNIKTLELRIQDSLARERMVADLSAALGVLALLLAAIGLYGILAYSVSRRSREIGIRMALGSGSGAVVWLVAREALVLVGAGSIAGIAIAILAARLLARFLFGVSPADPATLLVCASVMALIAVAAVSLPALRATRVDPLTALRHE